MNISATITAIAKRVTFFAAVTLRLSLFSDGGIPVKTKHELSTPHIRIGIPFMDNETSSGCLQPGARVSCWPCGRDVAKRRTAAVAVDRCVCGGNPRLRSRLRRLLRGDHPCGCTVACSGLLVQAESVE